MIEAQAQSITQDYSKRFRSSGAQTARQAAGQTAGALAGGFGPAGAALGTAISSGIEVGLGVVKFSEAADDFEPNLIESIGNVAAGTPTTAELMRLHLARHSDSLISTQADAIMAQLGTTSFIVAGEINYANCEQIGDLPLGAFESFGLQLYKDCMRVRKLMSREAQTDVYAQLQENLAQTLFASLQDILKMDIASPLSSVAASAAAGMVTSTIQKHLEEAKARILAESKRRELATEEYQTTTNKDSDPGKSSNAQGQAKPSGKSSAKPKPETLNFAPMRNKAKASSRTVPKSGQTHKVEPGDTVDAIAKKYGTTVEAITQANPWLKEHTFTDNHGRTIITIKPGEQIHITTSPITAHLSVTHTTQTIDIHAQDIKESSVPSIQRIKPTRQEVLEALDNANSAYENYVQIAKNKIQEHKDHKLWDLFYEQSSGAQSNIVEKINADGSKQPIYNTAGTAAPKLPLEALKETAKDIPADIAIAAGGRPLGKLANTVVDCARLIGEGLDRTGSETFTSDPEYKKYLRTYKGWDHIPDQVHWHIKVMERYNQVTGNNKPFIINGHSLGGSVGIIILVLRPDLVKFVNAIDAAGSYQLVSQLLSNDQAKVDQVYDKVNIYNAKPGQFPNFIGGLPEGKTVSAIGSTSHALDSIIDIYKKHGSTEVSANAYNFNTVFDHENKVLHVTMPLSITIADLAQKFNVPVENIVKHSPANAISAVEDMYARFTIKLQQ